MKEIDAEVKKKRKRKRGIVWYKIAKKNKTGKKCKTK